MCLPDARSLPTNDPASRAMEPSPTAASQPSRSTHPRNRSARPQQSPIAASSPFLCDGDFPPLHPDVDADDAIHPYIDRQVAGRTPLRLALAASSPSTPAAAPFNPDDFFASPLNKAASATRPKRTPECKRRLFLNSTDNPVTTPRSQLAPTSSVITPLRQVLAVGSTTSPQSGSFLTFGNLDTPRAGSSSAPSSSAGKKRGRAAIRDSMRVAAESSLAAFSIAPPASSHGIPSFLSPHRTVLPSANLLLPSPTPNSPRAKLFQTPHLALHDRKLPKNPLFMTPITPAEEAPSTKCSCKASRCLKLYCPCFASSGMCAEGCSCKNCQNTEATLDVVRDARQTVLSRDPKAFDPKVKSGAATNSNSGIHAKGCNCRKGCGKNYCVCRELRVSCGPRCTCSGPNGCLNGKDCPGEHENAETEKAIIGPAPAKYSTSLPTTNFPVRKQSNDSSKITTRLLEKPKLNGDVVPLKKEEEIMPGPSSADDANVDMQLDVAPRPFSMSPARAELAASLFATHKNNADDGIDALPVLRNTDGSCFSTPNSTRRLQIPSNGKRLDFDAEVEALTAERSMRNPGAMDDFSHVAGSSSKDESQPKYQLPGDGKLMPSLSKSPPRGSPGISRLEDLISGNKRQNSLSVDAYRLAEQNGANFESDRDKLSANDAEFFHSLRHPRGDPVRSTLFPGTPERIRTGAFSFATSPTTDARNRLMRSARARSESARPPRILRVKMGSGRALRKFAIGSE